MIARPSLRRRAHSGVRRPALPWWITSVLVAAIAWAEEPPTGSASPPRLAPADVVLSDSFERASSEAVYQAIAQQSGLKVTFDAHLRHQPVSIDLVGREPLEALHHLALLAGHFVVPIDERSLLVAQDTPQNRRNFEPLGLRTFALRHADVKDVMTQLRTHLDVRKISASSDEALVTVRDTYPKLALAEELVERMDREPWEVRVELEMLAMEGARLQRIAAAGAEVAAEAAAALRREATGGPLAMGTVGLVGRRAAVWKWTGAGVGVEDGGEQLVSLSLSGRLDPQQDTVTLDLELAAVLPAAARGSGLRQSSSFRVAAGSALALPVLHAGGGNGGPAMGALLLLTPRIVRPGELGSAEDETIYFGTESGLRMEEPGRFP